MNLFLNSETNRVDTGLVIELWNKGILWDKMIGCIWVPLESIHFSEQANDGQWLQVDADLDIFNGEICGTRNPTGHLVHVEMHFEPVYGMFWSATFTRRKWVHFLFLFYSEYQLDDVKEFSRNLKYINNYMDQEMYPWNNAIDGGQKPFRGHQLYCE